MAYLNAPWRVGAGTHLAFVGVLTSVTHSEERAPPAGELRAF